MSTSNPSGSLTALLSLLAAGACLGASTTLARVAGDLGLAPLPFLAWSIVGAAAMLMALAWRRGALPPVTRRTAVYFAIAAFVTVAGSNLIFFSAVPQVGVGFVSLTITLPPLLTYLGALAFGLERFQPMRAAGVAAALAGAGVLAFEKLAAPDAAVGWVLLSLLGPVLLAIGNLYRTMRWPPGLRPSELAPGMMVAAAVMLLLAGLLPGFTLRLPEAWVAPLGLIVVQAAIFTAQFLLLFVLQRTGGPVLLSLLGAVGAIVAVPAAILLLGEAPPGGLALGAGLIAAGIALVSLGGRRASA
ncbi:DMT family transporter [Pontivivens ytuae]|uniref:DMT family transporter n=1 Tax=Pontivivens ytuae TaxID=2789856 RepID=A0A7S9LT97_9RHOB|nr:DMT family transporter [Pontivivens ytuae]QPH54871.1 DMT family transporter [Pontivivens ytuae]